MITLSLEAKPLVDFVQCIEKSIKRPDYIYFFLHDGKLLALGESYDSRILFNADITQGGSILIGVDALEFISTVKRFTDEKLELKIGEKKVTIKVGNVTASYRTVSSEGANFEFNDASLELSRVSWLIDSLIKCDSSVDVILKDSFSFQDILLYSGETTYLTRFTESAIQVCSSENIGFKGRVVIPLKVAKVVKSFKGSIKNCSIGTKSISFYNENLRMSFPFMDDKYPEDCLSFLQLNKHLPLIDIDDNGYRFNRDYLFQAIDIVSSTVSDESQVKFEIVGDQNGFPVWKLSSKSVKGTYCEELVASVALGKVCAKSFLLNGKRTMKALNSYDGVVALIDHSRSTVALTGVDNSNDVTLLSKVAE